MTFPGTAVTVVEKPALAVTPVVVVVVAVGACSARLPPRPGCIDLSIGGGRGRGRAPFLPTVPLPSAQPSTRRDVVTAAVALSTVSTGQHGQIAWRLFFFFSTLLF